MSLPTSFTETTPGTIHAHTGGSSTDNTSAGRYNLSSDQAGDWVFGVGELSDGADAVLSGTFAYNAVDNSGFTEYYQSVSDVVLSIDDSGTVTPITIDFSGSDNPETPGKANGFEIVGLALSSGGFVIGESVSNQGGTGEDYFEILNNSGTVTKSWTAFKTTSNQSNNEFQIFSDPNGGFLVAYSEKDESDTYFQRYTASGTASGSTVQIASSDNTFGTLGEDSNDNVFVGYFSESTNSSASLAVYNSSGSVILSKETFQTAESSYLSTIDPGGYTIQSQAGQTIIPLAGGGFLISIAVPIGSTKGTGSESINYSTGTREYLQKVSISGSTVTFGTPVLLFSNTTTFTDGNQPDISGTQLSNGYVLLAIPENGSTTYELIDPNNLPSNSITPVTFTTPIGTIQPTSTNGTTIAALNADSSGGIVAAVQSSASGVSGYGYQLDASLYVADFDPPAPPSVTAGATATFNGGGSAVVLDSGLTVLDPESSTISSATISISSGFVSGDELSFSTQNGITGSYLNGTLTLSGSASVANYQTALESITYSFSPGNGDPTNGGSGTSRTISWSVNDGTSSSNTATSTLDVVHKPPVVAAGASVSYEIGTATPVALDGGLTVSDPDSGGDLSGGTVSITAGTLKSGDTLNFTTQNGITGSYNSSNGTLTLSGTATVAHYQTALESITFSTTSTTAGTRTIDWVAKDDSTSNGTNAAVTSTVGVTAGPSVTAGATVAFDGGGSAVTLDSGLTVSDPSNADLSSATVSITGGTFQSGDTLNFATQNGISGSYNASNGTLTLSGSATLAHYRTALASITYSFSPSDGDPTNGGSHTSRTIDWVVGDGTVSSATATSTLTTVHEPPVVTAGAAVNYEIGTGTPSALDGGLTVTDPDSSGDLSGGTVTITPGSFKSGDALNFTTQNGIAGSYNSTSGALTLSGSATVAQYQTALQSITFSTTSTTAGTRTIDWAANDGSTSNGTNTAVTSTVDVTAGPSVTAGATETFDGGGSAVVLDSGLTVSDPSNADLSSATVAIANDVVTGDTLNFTDQNGITGSFDSATGQLSLSGSATIADYQTALQSVTFSFSPSDGDPTEGGSFPLRMIAWEVGDGAVFSLEATSTLDVVHEPPVVTAGASVNYEIGAATPAVLDSGLTVSDPDSGGNLSGGTVTITADSFNSGDTLNFATQNGITGSYDSTSGVLTLSGSATVADYQTALASVTFSTASTTAGTRTIDWVASDGSTSNGTNTAVTSTVDVTAGPSVTAGATATYKDDPNPTPTTLDSTLTVADQSNTSFVGATIAITPGTFLSGDTLSFASQNGITGSYNSSTGTLTLTGTATVPNYQTALDSVGFSTTSLNTTARTIDWSLSDGAVTSAQATSTVDLVLGPSVVPASPVAYEQGAAAPTMLSSTLTLADPSSTTLVGATVAIMPGTFSSGDTLSFTNQNGITGSYNSATGTLTLTGTTSVANYQTALQSVGFSTSSAVTGDRTIDWSIGDGTVTSSVATSTVDVTAGPSVTAGATATFDGGGSAVALDSGVTASDPSNAVLSSATVSITTGTFQTGDTLNFTTQNGITGNYNASSGALTLSGSATVVEYQTALASITYSFNPSNGDPTAGGTHTPRTVDWVVSDGAVSSTTATSTLTTVHEPPVVTAGASPGYKVGGSAATVLDSGLTVSDPDSAGNLAGATVSITDVAAGDTLAFTNQNGIIGSYNSTTGTLTLSGSATIANYQTALQSITFSTSSITAGTRTIDWTVNDGSTSNGASTTVTSTVDVTAGPLVTAGATATFDGGGSPIVLDAALALTDPSSTTLAGATVSVTAGFIAGDTLDFTAQNGITGSYSNGTLTLSGSASVTNYQTALESITYSFSPSDGDPTADASDTSRTVEWVVNDGTTASPSAASTLDIVHEPPVLTAGGSAAFQGGGSPVVLDSGLTVSDPDSGGDLVGATVAIASGFLNGDTLNFTNQNGITGSYTGTTGALTLRGSASLSDYQAALGSITYGFNAADGDPTGSAGTSARTIDWSVNDGAASSTITTSTLTLVHEPPVVATDTVDVLDGGTATATAGTGVLSLDSSPEGDTLTVTAVDGSAGNVGTAIAGTYGSLNLNADGSFSYSASDTAAIGATPIGTQATDAFSYAANDGHNAATNGTLTFVIDRPPTGSPDTARLAEGATATATASNGVLSLDSSPDGDTLTVSAVDGVTRNVGAAVAGTYGSLTLNADGSYSYSASNTAAVNAAPIGSPPTDSFAYTASDGFGGSVTETLTFPIDRGAGLTAGATVRYIGGNSPIAADGGVTVSDPDNDNLTGATVSIGSGFLGGDALNFTNQNGIAGSFNATTGVLTLSGAASAADYQAALDSITYNFTNGDPTDGGSDAVRTVDWAVEDGPVTSTAVTSTIETVLLGSQYAFSALSGQAIRLVPTSGGSNLPAPVSGEFNLELVTSPSGTNYPTPTGYQGVAILPGGSGTTLQLLSGDIGVQDLFGDDTIIAGSGSDAINAIAGGESITLGSGLDTVFGGVGDTITAGTGPAYIDASAGHQTVTLGDGGSETVFLGAADTVTAGTGTSILNALAGDEQITLGSGSDTVFGAAGDTLVAGSGSAYIDASAGDQTVTLGDAGSETGFFGAGDTITAGTGFWVINGQAGNEQVALGSGSDTVYGGAGDTIMAGAGSAYIDASAGHQTVTLGDAGSETAIFGSGDSVTAGTGAWIINALAGNERITLGSGSDTVYGAAGDTLVAGSGSAYIDASAGNQTVTLGNAGSETAFFGVGDTVTAGAGAWVINALAGNERITLGSGSDTLYGGAGDTVFGGSGADYIDGTAGNVSIQGGSAGSDAIVGGAGDTVVGNAATLSIVAASDDVITAGSGASTINALAGDDMITLGSGADIVFGNGGDTVAAGSGSGYIDFNPGHTKPEFLGPGSGNDASGSDTVYNFNQALGDRIIGETSGQISSIVATQTTNPGGNAVVKLTDGSMITFVGVSAINASVFT